MGASLVQRIEMRINILYVGKEQACVYFYTQHSTTSSSNQQGSSGGTSCIYYDNTLRYYYYCYSEHKSTSDKSEIKYTCTYMCRCRASERTSTRAKTHTQHPPQTQN
jgi:hypothetical protein